MTNLFLRLRTVAAIAAALSVLGSVPAAASAAPQPARGTTTTPAVGDCHTLTYDEAQKASDPDATVDCSTAHTSITIKVVNLTNPDWSDVDKIARQIDGPCWRGVVDQLGGSTKKAQMSAYTMYFFVPTKAEQDAGATWVRCDATLRAWKRLPKLPSGSDISLGSLPLPSQLAKCRSGKRHDYAVVACSQRHLFRATIAIKYPDGAYPGRKAATRYALRKCRARISSAFYYEPLLSRFGWKLGYRHAICLPKTRS